MKIIGIVSCDKWLGKIQEDMKLQTELQNEGFIVDIISWQQPFYKSYDMLILRSIWGYQNYYAEFKKWLLEFKKSNVKVLNSPELVMENILKEKQFEILKKNKIDYIPTHFIKNAEFNYNKIINIITTEFEDCSIVIKPTISGSGENTYLINSPQNINTNQNQITITQIEDRFKPLLSFNNELGLMIQPYIPEINNGEYSCLFISGTLMYAMLRFPHIFHDKKNSFIIKNIPEPILNLANKVEQLNEFSGYLYMRVDMVLIENEAKIMEVELTDPDFLSRHVDETTCHNLMKTLSKEIKRRL